MPERTEGSGPLLLGRVEPWVLGSYSIGRPVLSVCGKSVWGPESGGLNSANWWVLNTFCYRHAFICQLQPPPFTPTTTPGCAAPSSPLLPSPLLSQAAALSDRRHRLGDESLRVRSSKSQTSWCGFDRDPGICCSFSNGSKRQIDLSFISSICGRVCVCVWCVYMCDVCLSGRFNAKLWWEHMGLTQVGCVFLLPLVPS